MDEPKKGDDRITPVDHPTIRELLVQLGHAPAIGYFDGDQAIKNALKEFLDLRKGAPLLVGLSMPNAPKC